MPQMSPMPWFILMVYTMIIILMISSVLYFNSELNLNKIKKYDNKTIFNIWSNSKL